MVQSTVAGSCCRFRRARPSSPPARRASRSGPRAARGPRSACRPEEPSGSCNVAALQPGARRTSRSPCRRRRTPSSSVEQRQISERRRQRPAGRRRISMRLVGFAAEEVDALMRLAEQATQALGGEIRELASRPGRPAPRRLARQSACRPTKASRSSPERPMPLARSSARCPHLVKHLAHDTGARHRRRARGASCSRTA